jgi:hypothetical protein
VIDADTPIVRLFVPYVPSRDDELLTAACPEVEPLRVASPHLLHTWTPPADGEPSHLVRECFGRLWRVSLDGELVEEAPVFTYREPGPQPGLGIYLRVDALEPGRHLVRVERWQGPEDELGRDEPQWAVFNLPFWR